MKTVIIGSRDFRDYEYFKKCIREIREPITEIISGGVKGADTLAERYALENHIPIQIFKPDYGRYGKGAPWKRNVLIIKFCDQVIAFPSVQGSGTQHAISEAKKLSKPVKIFTIS